MKVKLRTGAALLLALSVTAGLVGMVRQQLDYDRGAADYREARQLAGLAEAESASASALPEESALRQTLREIDLPALQQINPEVIGWILIPGTGISYPLMQTEDNDYYLKNTWKREKNSSGAVFLDYRNSASFSDFNSLIYGHRMRNGSMFGSLHNYKETAFWETSPSIYIINADGIYRYDIFAAYEADVKEMLFTPGVEEPSQRQKILERSGDCSVIRTGIAPTVTEPVLTLVTCTGKGYSTRWVVQAVRAEPSLG